MTSYVTESSSDLSASDCIAKGVGLHFCIIMTTPQPLNTKQKPQNHQHAEEGRRHQCPHKLTVGGRQCQAAEFLKSFYCCCCSCPISGIWQDQSSLHQQNNFFWGVRRARDNIVMLQNPPLLSVAVVSTARGIRVISCSCAFMQYSRKQNVSHTHDNHAISLDSSNCSAADALTIQQKAFSRKFPVCKVSHLNQSKHDLCRVVHPSRP